MKWSWKIGEVAGIRVQIHATFAILLVWLAMRAWTDDPSFVAVFAGLAFVIVLFGCIVLHELGHALTARRFGIQTRDITLLPIGGVARLERMPEEPLQEWLVAMAGPAVNLVLAALLFAGLWLAGNSPSEMTVDVADSSFAIRLMWVNVLLLVFNLVPAFPMDGGRALRAILASRLPYVQATRVAAGIGQAIALAFGALGLFTNPFLVFIALFVWIGAAGELSMVETRTALEGLCVSDAMLTDFDVLAPGDRLSRAVELTLAGSQKDFPVMEGASLRGVLTQDALVRGLSERGAGAAVAVVMLSVPQPLAVDRPVGEILDQVNSGARLLPVIDRGRLVGIVTADNVLELLRFRGALRAPAPVARGPLSQAGGPASSAARSPGWARRGGSPRV
jgi:Zn-dependent protease